MNRRAVLFGLGAAAVAPALPAIAFSAPPSTMGLYAELTRITRAAFVPKLATDLLAQGPYPMAILQAGDSALLTDQPGPARPCHPAPQHKTRAASVRLSHAQPDTPVTPRPIPGPALSAPR